MIRQSIIINEHLYVCDLYKAHDDLHDSVQREFVMLRKYDIMSDIVYDTDIYFVEKSIINQVVEDLDNKDLIVWPIPGTKGTAFTQNYNDYNSDYSPYTFSKNGADLFKLYRQNIDDAENKEYKEAKIYCDKIRIYHPQTKIDLDYIIYVDNYINDIHFHYYCQKSSNLEPQTESEFRISTNIYSEFVEFYIPNIEDIISKEIFYKEDINILSINDSQFIDSYKYLIDELNVTTNKIVAYEAKYNLSTFSFANETIQEDEFGKYIQFDDGIIWHLVEDKLSEDDIKYGIKHFDSYWHAIIRSKKFDEVINNPNNNDYGDYNVAEHFPIIQNKYFEEYKGDISWTPIYEELVLNTTKGKLYEDTDIVKDLKFAVYTESEEDTTNIVLASSYLFTIPFMLKRTNSSEADYPEYQKVFLPEVEKTIENNYLTYPICLTIFPYSEVNENTGKYVLDEKYQSNSDVFTEELRFTLSSKLGFNNGKISVINTFNYPNKHKFSSFREAYEHYNNVSFDDYSGIIYYDEDDDEENEIEQKQCAFEIVIASDVLFKQVIYKTFFELNEADDFSFNLDGIFDSWNNLPELLICHVRFIDRYIGTSIYGNNVIITKDWYKYCINDIQTNRVHQFVHRQQYLNENVKITKDSDMDLKNINFIDKINCIITKPGETQTIYNLNNRPKIVYKPIFYRTQDLQNITLRSGMMQNIGINLGDYMTKVSTFKLVIDKNTFVETARNDVFTIFRVDTTIFNSTVGTYHILNEEDEYISSGNWQING